MNKNRIKVWIIVLVITASITAIQYYNENKPTVKKQEISVYFSSTYNDAEEKILKNFNASNLGEKYNLKISYNYDENKVNSEAIITEDYNIISSEDKCKVLGETPLIVVMKKTENIKKYKDNGLLNASQGIDFNKNDEVEINFKQIMEAVINNEHWNKFGGEDKEIRVFYPEDNSIEGKLFKHFLLITANNGKYPSSTEEMESSQKYVNEFLAKENVKSANVFNRIQGIDDIGDDIYCIFENEILQLDKEFSEYIYITYPTETIVKEVYFESLSKIGDEIEEILYKNNGIFGLNDSIRTIVTVSYRYRNSNYSTITDFRNRFTGIFEVINAKDYFNKIEIPKQYLKQTKVN